MLRSLSILILLSVLCLPQEGQAQKKKRKNPNRINREAEFYFTEAEKYFILEDYAKALVLFDQAREIAPENAAIYYKMAEIYMNNDELDKALDNIKKALKFEDNNKYYFLLAANVQTRLGNFQNAAALYEEMIGRIENTGHYLLELAAIYMYEDQLDKALETYQRAEDYFGVSSEIISQKQKILLKQNNLNGAIAEGEKLIAQNPDNEGAVISQAELLVSNNRIEESIKFLEGHLKDYPNHIMVGMFIGNLYITQGLPEKAAPYLKKAFESPVLNASSKIQTLAMLRSDLSDITIQELSIHLAKNLVVTHSNIADAYSVYGDILFALGKHDQARQQYLKALKLDGSNFTLWQNVLQLYLQSSKYDSVLILSDNALELFPNQNALYYYRGLANLRKSNFSEAIAELKHGKMLSSSDPKLVSAFNGMLGEAYFGLKEYNNSDAAFDAALDYDPDNSMVLNNYSYFLALRNENLDKAEQMAQKLVENNPGVFAYTDTYAWVLYRQKKYKEARDILAPAIESGKAKGTYHDHFGNILFKLGEKEQALEHWKIAREKDASIKNIDKKIADQRIYE